MKLPFQLVSYHEISPCGNNALQATRHTADRVDAILATSIGTGMQNDTWIFF